MTMAKDAPLSRIIGISDVDWGDLRPGIKVKALWQDPDTARRAVLLRIDAGSEIPQHKHVGDEFIFVVEGAIEDDYGAVTAGNCGYRPEGCAHTVRSPKGATVFAVISGSTEAADSTAGSPASRVFSLADLEWVESRPGVRQKKIWEDAAQQRRAVLSRFEPGATLPRHRHNGDELILVLEGAVEDEAGPVTAGNMNHRPNGCVHTVTSKNGATVLAQIWGSTEPL